MSEVMKPILLDETGQSINTTLGGLAKDTTAQGISAANQTIGSNINTKGNQIAEGLRDIANAISGKKTGTIYGFHINGSESDPEAAVTYLADAVGMNPAGMSFSSGGSFSYGSWERAFFMPRPCMLKYDGTVDYYLKENDYTKKEDGTASDVTNTSYAGNAMMEWGRNDKKIWMKIVPTSGDAKSGDVFIADYQADPDFHDWPFHNCDGVSVPHFYTPIYNGSLIDGKLRTLSGQALIFGKTAQEELDAAHANNPGQDILWETEVLADIELINALHYLMFKTLDVPAKLGLGFTSSNEAGMKAWRTGELNTKGLFFGYNDGTHAVKSFGMENWWGMQWRRYLGHIMVNGSQKCKLTRGTEDGSSAEGYNLTGDGYITKGVTPGGTSGGYISEVTFTEHGIFPKTASGSSSTYFCDGLWFNNAITSVPLRGGRAASGVKCGVASVNLNSAAGDADWNVGASLSCKPLAA